MYQQLICAYCKKPFSPKRRAKRAAKFCSKDCQYRGNDGIFKRGDGHPCWNGGSFLRVGYITQHTPSHPQKDSRGYVFEHRLVMEKHLGRYLLPTEFIHHINGDKTDNRIENLRLCSSHSEHTTIHHKGVSNGEC